VIIEIEHHFSVVLVYIMLYILHLSWFSDPHVKVCGSKADVMKAKGQIMEMFDVKVKLWQ